jgi:hypothetical protein
LNIVWGWLSCARICSAAKAAVDKRAADTDKQAISKAHSIQAGA